MADEVEARLAAAEVLVAEAEYFKVKLGMPDGR